MNKQRFGQYFTPKNIADFMCSLISKPQSARVLEPSAGLGVFIESLKSAGFNNIKGYELDKTLKNKKLSQFIRYRDFLDAPLKEQFDVIIGNPPYIRWRNIEEKIKAKLGQNPLWQNYCNRLCDYLFIFILQSIEKLTSKGELIFISPTYWFNSTHSQKLRNYMLDHGSISDVYLFNDSNIFKGVSGSFVVFKYVKGAFYQNLTLHTFKQPYKEQLSFGKKVINDFFTISNIPQWKRNTTWSLKNVPQNEQLLLQRFEESCKASNEKSFLANDLQSKKPYKTIGDYFEIANGMVSGLDRAFNIEKMPKDLISSLTALEKEHLIRVFKAKNLRPFYHQGEAYYFFLTQDIAEDKFKELYPNIYKHLLLFKEKLTARYNYGKALSFWKFAFPRNLKLFKSLEKRIFVPCKERISNKKYFRFTLADNDVFALQDVTAIVRKNKCLEEIEYVLAYLNNPRVFAWLAIHGVVKGEIVEFSERPIASIPYRCINFDDYVEVAIYQQIVTLTKKLLATKDLSLQVLIEKEFDKLF